MKSISILFVVISSVIFLSLSGCGDGRARRVPVAGTVTIDGQPLSHGSVTFMPLATTGESRAGGGSLNENGEFALSSYTPNDGLLAGKYQVMVLAIEPINETSQRWHAPQKYSGFKSSGLNFDITEAVSDLKIELTWEDDDDHSAPYVEKF